MTEIRARDQNLGEVLICFDGRIAEVFTERQGSAVRLHLAMLVMHAEGPDRRGRTSVDLAPVRPGQGGVRLVFADTDLSVVEPLLDEIRAALAKTAPGSPPPLA